MKSSRSRFLAALGVVVVAVAGWIVLKPSAVDRAVEAAVAWDADAFGAAVMEIGRDEDAAAKLKARLAEHVAAEGEAALGRIEASLSAGQPEAALAPWKGLRAAAVYAGSPLVARVNETGARLLAAVSERKLRAGDASGALADHGTASSLAGDADVHAGFRAALLEWAATNPEPPTLEAALEMVLQHDEYHAGSAGICSATLGAEAVGALESALAPYDARCVVVAIDAGERTRKAVLAKLDVREPLALRTFEKKLPRAMTERRLRQCEAACHVTVEIFHATYGGGLDGIGGFSVPEAADLDVARVGGAPPWPLETWHVELELPAKLMGTSSQPIAGIEFASPSDETSKQIERFGQELDAKVAAYVETWPAWTIP